MSDYISQEAAIEKIREAAGCAECDGNSSALCVCTVCDFYNAIRLIKSIPAADVEPVRHGRWVVDYPDGTIYEGAALRLMFALITCSECGKTFELAKIGKARYCTCGSKMDLEEQNEP